MGITEGFNHRTALGRILKESPADRNILQLAPEELLKEGVLVLALDYDGVLAPHGADCPLPEVEEWLEKAVEQFSEERIFILSNRPIGPRVDWFRAKFSGIRFISGVRKKPYIDGLKKTGELASVPLSSILMADDRLLTGCLAAVIAGAVPFYVRRPFVKTGQNFHKELFFIMLRSAERIFVQLFA